uniref:Potassium efflux system protein n=1 Tax=Candidatus Kentrum sp. LPFa TaxID=2126335 RepID=A0A450WRG2_9GAMM|nr:MAG: potassium efflux system protein [Candidatus Kentron sp. LPFa]
MKAYSFVRWIALLSFWITLSAMGAEKVDPDEMTPKAIGGAIDAGRKALEADTALGDAERQKASEGYAEAEKALQGSDGIQAEFADLARMVREAPRRIKKLRARIGKPRKDGKLDAILAKGNPAMLKRMMDEKSHALLDAREAHKKQMEALSELIVGTKEASERIAANRKSLDRIAADLAAPPDESAPLARARLLSLEARGILLKGELSLLTLRQDHHDTLVELAQLERDVAGMEIARYQSDMDRIEEAMRGLRKDPLQAREEAEKRALEAETLPDPLAAIAREIAEYHAERDALAQEGKALAEKLRATKTRVDEIEDDFQRVRERMAMVGASKAIGDILRARRNTLPSMRSYRRASDERKDRISRAMDRQLEIDERLQHHGAARNVLRELAVALSDGRDGDTSALEEKAEELVRERRDLLNELQKVYGSHIGSLTSLDLAERQLVSVASDYLDYIDDQLIWIPDPGLKAPDLSGADSRAGLSSQGTGEREESRYLPILWGLQTSARGLFWLGSPGNWSRLLADCIASMLRHPVLSLLLLGLFVFLQTKKKRIESRLKALSADAGKITDKAFVRFLEAVLLSVLAIAGWPLLMIGLGYGLTRLPTVAPFSAIIGEALFGTGMVLAASLFLLRANARDGLGDRHLRWPASIREILIREFRWAISVIASLGFLASMTASDAAPLDVRFLGREIFVVLMAAVLVFLYRLLHARGPLMAIRYARVSEREESDPVLQFHFLWFSLLLLLPFGLSILSLFGYRTMALHLNTHLEMSAWFLVGLFLVREFVRRYLDIAERRLRYQEAVKKREEMQAQRAREGGESDQSAPLMEIPEIDFHELGGKAQRLVHGGIVFCAVIGAWLIWSDLLVALGFLTDANLSLYPGDTVAEKGITLGNVTTVLILLVITVLAARNIPGVLEIALLQRLPLSIGGRYAFTTLTQYGIVGAGLVAIFDIVGLDWSKIQWLVAALSVGLGFGLQEIVANFISGIILLFERPIRVGDVVTIDNTTGMVSRIRIRATTIVTWDKQELLIPNKDLITGRLTNWTLSDKMSRITITVGIAYGSDVALAMKLLVEAATEHEEILKDPTPFSTFEGFGDNALTLVLRAYVGSLENRLAIVTALHQAINDKFNAAGLSIAFPQRDIHLDASKPLELRLVSRRG